MRPPEGYDGVEVGTNRAFALPVASDWVGSALVSGVTLHDWAAGLDGSRVFSGRGDVFAFPSPPDPDEWWVVRHYRRGGAIARMLEDRYVLRGPTRPIVETTAVLAARREGISTPEVIAAAVYPAGRFYRADLVTRLVLDARNLAEAVFGPTSSEDRQSALSLAGSLMRDLESAGILHVDFNAANILIQNRAGMERAWVLDLDRAELFPAGGLPRGVMRRRLERSLRKFERAHGRPLTHEDWSALRSGYQAGT